MVSRFLFLRESFHHHCNEDDTLDPPKSFEKMKMAPPMFLNLEHDRWLAHGNASLRDHNFQIID